MRKFLLLIAVALFSTATYAQLWSKSISAVAEGDAVSQNSPAAMDKDGNLYVTGTKTLPIEFAGQEVGGNDTGAYIAKYNVEGEELYAIELIGSIDITAITTDADNNFYVAGSFAGGAFIKSVDGEFESISNSEADSKTATFIAKYNAEGKLLAVKSYEAVTPSVDAWDPVNVSITKIVAEGSKVYAEFNYTGNITLEENLTLSAKFQTLDLFGFIMVSLSNNVSVVSFDSDFTNPTVVATLAIADNCDQSSKLFSSNFAVDGEDVYVAAFGRGNLVLNSEAFDFEFDGEGTTEKGAILSKVGTKSVKISNIPNGNDAEFNIINEMEVRDGKLYLVGTFNETCAFDNSKVATGASDVFVASIDANELTATWVYTNANDEGETNKFYEEVTGVVFGKEHVYVVDAVTDMNNAEAPVAKNYAVSYEGVANEGVIVPATAVAYNENNVAVINYTDATYITMFGAELTTSIDSVVVESENNVIYDLTGRRIEKITNAGIYIVNGNKVLVK